LEATGAEHGILHNAEEEGQARMRNQSIPSGSRAAPACSPGLAERRPVRGGQLPGESQPPLHRPPAQICGGDLMFIAAHDGLVAEAPPCPRN